jgi:protein TonB
MAVADDIVKRRLPSPKRLPALAVAVLLHVLLVAFLMLRTEATPPGLAPQIVTVALMPAAATPLSRPAGTVLPPMTVLQLNDKAIRPPQMPPIPRPKAAPHRHAVQEPTPTSAVELSRSTPTNSPTLPATKASFPVPAQSDQPGVVSEPAPISSNPAPIYPVAARKKGIEGTVVLKVSVDVDGQPTSISVTTSSGHDVLDAEAVRTVRMWRFQPALAHGLAVAGLVIVPIVFELHS